MYVSIVLSGEDFHADVSLYRSDYCDGSPVDEAQLTTMLRLGQGGQRTWNVTLIGVTPDLLQDVGERIANAGCELRQQILNQLAGKAT